MQMNLISLALIVTVVVLKRLSVSKQWFFIRLLILLLPLGDII